MAFLAKVAGLILKIGEVADREVPLEMRAVSVYGRDFSATSQVGREHRAAGAGAGAGAGDTTTTITVIKYFLLTLLISFFLLISLSCLVARRSNQTRLNSNEDREGDQPNGEPLLPIRNAAEANQSNAGTEIVEIEPPLETEPYTQSQRWQWLYTLEAKFNNFGTRFAIANLLIECPSVVLDQITSEKKPTYVLILMLLSLTSMLVSLTELVYKGRKEKITWRWRRGGSNNIIMPWFYYPPPRINRRFGTLPEMVGLSCATAQLIVTTTNYCIYRRHHSIPIKLNLWPIIFAFGIVCCRFMANPNEEEDHIGEENNSTPHVARS